MQCNYVVALLTYNIITKKIAIANLTGDQDKITLF